PEADHLCCRSAGPSNGLVLFSSSAPGLCSKYGRRTMDARSQPELGEHLWSKRQHAVVHSFPCSGRRSNGADDILCKVQLYPADADKAEQQHRTLAVLLEVGLKLVLADHNLQQRLDHDLHPELSSRQPTHHRRVCPASKP